MTEPVEVKVEIVEKKPLSENKEFYKTAHKTEHINATYYEMTSPIPFTTRVSRIQSETVEFDTEVKDSRSVFYLFGFLPLGGSETFKIIKEKRTVSNYFCELTPEMEAWVTSMKPYCQDLIRNRGKLAFRPTDEEITARSDIQVYPFLVEYGGVTGIGWRRYTRIEETLPA